MRLLRSSLAFAIFLLASCTATPEPLPTVTPTNTPIPLPTSTSLPQRMPVLRIAVFGEVTNTNVWALFDEAGADYWNDATQSAYWPSLYHLTPPSLDFQPATAIGTPSPLACDSAFCTATVTLKPGLTWTDGSPFTAEDVAFTANTALQFRLGLNWQQAYNPDVLDHAEALDASTGKFYFKSTPTVADWQYGALQGPIVNHAYWQLKIGDAVSLLPDETLLATIRQLEQELAVYQTAIDSLNISLNKMAPASSVYQETSNQAQRFQDELNSISNKIDKNRTVYKTKLSEARAVLFMLTNTNEPTLGAWSFSTRTGKEYENQANLGTPFGDPWFDSVQYITYSDEFSAVQALENNEVDIVLTSDGLSASSVSRLQTDNSITLFRNQTRSARFLAFNHANPYLADPALHQALACMLDPLELSEILGADAPLPAFVLDDFWRAEAISLPCAGESETSRLEKAVNILKSAGYSWRDEPALDVAGVELRDPNGKILPNFILLAPQSDFLRVKVSAYISQQAKALGLSMDAQQRDSDELLYAVYGSRDYDIALLGWRLSAYPAYLCEWFTPPVQNPFAYSGSRLKAECEAWNATSDLDEARKHASEIQSILMQDLPLIPIYANVRVDAYRNIHFPFEKIPAGLSGLYGAPGFAVPNP